MAASRASQKRQTRLTFTPIPSSSSPVAKESSPRILSNVRFETPRTRRLLGSFTRSDALRGGSKSEQQSSDTSSKSTQLPTPRPSSQIQTLDDGSPVRNNENSTTRPLPGTSSQSEAESDDDVVLPRTQSRRQRITPRVESSYSEKYSSTTQRKVAKRKSNPTNEETPSRRSQRLSHSLQSRKVLDTDTEDDDQSPAPSQRSQRALRSRGKPRDQKRERLRNQSTALASLSEIAGAESTSDEDLISSSKSTVRRRTRKPPTTSDNFIVGDDVIELVSSEEEDILPRSSRLSGQQKRRFSSRNDISSEEESENSDIKTPSKRKRVGRLIRSSKDRAEEEDQEEMDELKEDLENLQDSDVDVRDTRTRGRPANTARNKYRQGLEALKRSRANRSSPTQRNELASDEDDNGQSSHAHATIRIPSDDELSITSHSDKPASDDDLDTYDDDFIVEEEDGPLAELPLEFSRWATAPPREHFRNVVEWLVKNKISPAFDRSSELFNLSFRKINDEVKAQAGSRYISSAWKSEFKRALEARPRLQVVRIAGEGGAEGWWETCAACGRTGHPATWSFQFQGRPYYHDSLDPVGEDDSEDSEDESSDPADPSELANSPQNLDSNAQPIVPESHTFPLGRTCAANASIAHKLTHWKYHLNQYILELMHDNDLLTPAAIVERDGKSQRRREKEAETFIEELDNIGDMEQLWGTWKAELAGARTGMEDWDEPMVGKLGKGRGPGSGMGKGIWK